MAGPSPGAYSPKPITKTTAHTFGKSKAPQRSRKKKCFGVSHQTPGVGSYNLRKAFSGRAATSWGRSKAPRFGTAKCYGMCAPVSKRPVTKPLKVHKYNFAKPTIVSRQRSLVTPLPSGRRTPLVKAKRVQSVRKTVKTKRSPTKTREPTLRTPELERSTSTSSPMIDDETRSERRARIMREAMASYDDDESSDLVVPLLTGRAAESEPESEDEVSEDAESEAEESEEANEASEESADESSEEWDDTSRMDSIMA